MESLTNTITSSERSTDDEAEKEGGGLYELSFVQI